jgi:hypothetical protein
MGGQVRGDGKEVFGSPEGARGFPTGDWKHVNGGSMQKSGREVMLQCLLVYRGYSMLACMTVGGRHEF